MAVPPVTAGHKEDQRPRDCTDYWGWFRADGSLEKNTGRTRNFTIRVQFYDTSMQEDVGESTDEGIDSGEVKPDLRRSVTVRVPNGSSRYWSTGWQTGDLVEEYANHWRCTAALK
jgi:hypothetical protein